MLGSVELASLAARTSVIAPAQSMTGTTAEWGTLVDGVDESSSEDFSFLSKLFTEVKESTAATTDLQQSLSDSLHKSEREDHVCSVPVSSSGSVSLSST